MSDDSIMLGYYKRFLAGDESAFTYLVRAYYDQLLFFVSRIVGNFRDAEEIASDAFVHIAVRKKAFRGEASLKTYLFAVGRNKAVDLVRKNAARRFLPPFRTPKRSPTKKPSRGGSCAPSATGSSIRRYRSFARITGAFCISYTSRYECSRKHHRSKKTRKQTENLIWRARQALRAILEKDGWEYENL